MKTQRNHNERQLLHSSEIARHRMRDKEVSEVNKYQGIGWGIACLMIGWMAVAIIWKGVVS